MLKRARKQARNRYKIARRMQKKGVKGREGLLQNAKDIKQEVAEARRQVRDRYFEISLDSNGEPTFSTMRKRLRLERRPLVIADYLEKE